MQTRGDDGRKIERGVPLHTLWDYTTMQGPGDGPTSLERTAASWEAEKNVGKPNPFTLMRKVLADWVATSKENHKSMEHREELTGEECWTTHHTEDVRRMINDAEQEYRGARHTATV